MTGKIPEPLDYYSLPPEEDAMLVARLRAEAAATRPAFSPELHRRLVQALREQAACRRVAVLPAHGTYVAPRLGMLVAAVGVVCLLFLGVFGWWMYSQNTLVPTPQAAASAVIAADPLAGVSVAIGWPTRAAAGVDEALANVWNLPPAARLRENTRQVALTLLTRLPVDVAAAPSEPQVEQ